MVNAQTSATFERVLPADVYDLTNSTSARWALFDSLDIVIADLSLVSPKSIAARGVPVIGFFDHLERNRRARATQLGIDIVTRDALVSQAPQQFIQRHLDLARLKSRELRISSIHASEVTRVLIGGRGTCPSPT